ncbi:MAG TPA: glycoside hydrolase family 3 N-terminal domain-containing protein [Ktedonobacterales bacterium]|nr:glycoside hydrolase family 3 N-terminal domain-containing protein [Ktedonobacterales bacterium]
MMKARLARCCVVCCCLLVILSGCSAPFANGQPTPTLTTSAAPSPTPTPALTTESDIARALVAKMNLDEKLGQMVIVEFFGATLNADLKQMIAGYHIGGVLIENGNGNVQSRAQLLALNHAMQGQATIPLFISTDYEGHYTGTESTPLNELRRIVSGPPSEPAIAQTGNPQVAYNAGLSAAHDLTALGLNIDFMPIVDVLTNPNNPALSQRTFGSDPRLVTNMGRAYLQGLTAGGVIGSLKHFPGLGSATIDPHKSLPFMNRSLATMNSVDLVPYRTLIGEGIVPMVMVTHILNEQLDPKLPTSLSSNVITNLLRHQLGFRGVIICDTLWMGGISNTYTLAQAAVLTVQAGTNLLLGPRGLRDTEMMLAGLKQAVTSGRIPMEQIDTSVQLLLEMKLHYHLLSRAQALQLLAQGR